MQEYNHRDTEPKWSQYWQDNNTYRVIEDTSRPKYYVLDMFPYPSGAGLHVGHPLGYIATDIFTRYKRLTGFNVLHPMGFDAFGLPTEQYALQTGIHPAVSTRQNTARYREQMIRLGFSYDWNREVNTSDPSYYKWTQWIFTQLFDHYYDPAERKAKSIETLIQYFEQHGNAGLHAITTFTQTFSAAEWIAMNAKEQADIVMEYRLAYRTTGYVNWCEELGTVLANDQIKDGVSERGGYPVVKKAMEQWNLRITAYADRLLEALDDIDWSDALKTIQRNWIGRSEGASIWFNVKGHDEKIEVYTTRPDTIFGATFMVLAPEHPLVDIITTESHLSEVTNYRIYVDSRSEVERQAEVKKVTGAFTGAYAYNPFTQQHIPIWIAEYVLLDYGTGAIMAVPSDDERDLKFAEKFGIEIIDVVDKSEHPGATLHDKVGKIINSGFITGMQVPEAIEAVIQRVEEMKIGRRQINYKMRDANFSRQRYWGEPFPIVYNEDGIAFKLPLEELPLTLPDADDFKPTASGQSPLAKVKSWVHAKPGFQRETDTMPAVAGSSWYYLRYMDPHNEGAFASQEAIQYWQDVDLYVGGAEHAVAHLMYARFWHKFLFDLQLVPTDEPFKKLINQGMIQGVIESIYLDKEKVNGRHRFVCARVVESEKDHSFARIPVPIEFVSDYGTEDSFLDAGGIERFIAWSPEYKDAIFECGDGKVIDAKTIRDETTAKLYTLSEIGKMSKSKYNVINPDDVIENYGTDCLRMYEMFLGPLENSKPWDTKGIDGVYKFIRKLWRLFFDDQGRANFSDDPAGKEELKILHHTIKRIQEDIERFSFNTCISTFMVAVNELRNFKKQKREILEPLTVLISPFAPFLAEELWHHLGHNESVHLSRFPELKTQYLIEEEINYPISINGKKRGEATFPADANNQEIESAALNLDIVQRWTEGKTIRKVIVVPKRMVNIVAS